MSLIRSGRSSSELKGEDDDPSLQSLRTRCFGRVTVNYTLPGGGEQSNTCESSPPDGSANQINPVAGVTSVMYDLDQGAFADVTVS